MKSSDRKLISRGLDGALTEEERMQLERLRTDHPEAGVLERQWTAIGDQVRRVTPAPDSAVAWQDIHRAIRNLESTPDRSPFMRLGWAATVAALFVATLLGLSAWRLYQGSAPVWVAENTPANRVEWVVAEIPGATTMIYTDTETDMTVIWMDVAQSADPRDS